LCGNQDIRASESQQYAVNATAWAEYSGLRADTAALPDPEKCEEFTRETLADMDQFFGEEMKIVTWWNKYRPLFQAKRTAYKVADSSLSTIRGDADAAQDLFESSYCHWQEMQIDGCEDYNPCWDSSEDNYDTTKARVLESEAARKMFYKSGRTVLCHLEVILYQNITHAECEAVVYETAAYDISYPTLPTRIVCENIQETTTTPCNEAFRGEEYIDLPANTEAKECTMCEWEVTTTTTTTTTTQGDDIQITMVTDGEKYPIDASHGGHHGTTTNAVDAWKAGHYVMWKRPYTYDVQYKLQYSSVVCMCGFRAKYDAGATIRVLNSAKTHLGEKSCYESNGGVVSICDFQFPRSCASTFFVDMDSHHTTWNWFGEMSMELCPEA